MILPPKNLCSAVPFLEELRQELVLQFLAELMRATIDAENQNDFQQVLKEYCEGFRPWLECINGPLPVRSTFSLLESYNVDKTDENSTVVLPPEAEALFRAWLRRNKIWSDGGLNTMHAWSN